MEQDEMEKRMREIEENLTPEEKQAKVDKFMSRPYLRGINQEAQREYRRLKELQSTTDVFRDEADYLLLKRAFENAYNNREKKRLEQVITGQKNWIKDLKKAIEKPDIKLYYSYLKTMTKALEDHIPELLG